jgi:hypothetical protein
MDVLHGEPPVANVGFATVVVNEAGRLTGYGRNPQSWTNPSRMERGRSRARADPERERVFSQGLAQKEIRLRHRFLLTLGTNTHRIIDFRPALELQDRLGVWGDGNYCETPLRLDESNTYSSHLNRRTSSIYGKETRKS